MKSQQMRLSMLAPSRQSGFTDSVKANIQPLEKPIPINWDAIEAEIFLFYACQLSHASKAVQISKGKVLISSINFINLHMKLFNLI